MFCLGGEPGRDQILGGSGSLPDHLVAGGGVAQDCLQVAARRTAPSGMVVALGPLALASAERAARSYSAVRKASVPGGGGEDNSVVAGYCSTARARLRVYPGISHPNRKGGIEMAQQGSLELLNDPVAKALLGSVNPARLAYTWMDGSPRVVPIWFHWTGEQFVLGSPPKAPKLRALAAEPRVALTIDDNQWPHKVLLVRGRASMEMLDDVSPEYELCGNPLFRAGGRTGLGQHAAGKAHGPHRHHTWLGRDTGLPNPVPECPDALEPAGRSAASRASATGDRGVAELTARRARVADMRDSQLRDLSDGCRAYRGVICVPPGARPSRFIDARP